MDLVTSLHQPAREIGYKRLRPAALRLPDGRNQWGDNRDLHRAITLNARSHGGLIPSAS